MVLACVVSSPSLAETSSSKPVAGLPLASNSALAVRSDWRSRATRAWRAMRSEEHTSELQSLMRISYAVFCLKKKHATYTTLPEGRKYINIHQITKHRMRNKTHIKSIR